MDRWYVVHTQPQGESKALANLERQGFRTYWPRFAKRRSHARRVDTVPASLFPRYLFVRLDPDNAPWRAVRSTYGVAELVCQGDRPSPLPDGVIEALQARQGEDGLVDMPAAHGLRPGAKVRVTEGPLTDLAGVFDGLSDGERVVVLIDMLGRPVRVSLPMETVAPL